MENYTEELKERVRGQGVAVVTLGELRTELVKVDRLGKHVVRQIRDRLDQEGFTFFPREVLISESPRQENEVRLVLTDSDAGRIVRAVLDPHEKNDRVFGNYFSAGGNNMETPMNDALKLIETAEAVLKDALEMSRS